ncbi:hypothetical protein DYB25_009139 [Aphanomyces astaci]|uniref:Uncharacterized protein n=2 Tax=Aphanomyces astaci TaxID=112090 RepID=A0A397ANK7_APHAT|nr:hypothetical protein DYB25_009139 [Aphanomyces astaci]
MQALRDACSTAIDQKAEAAVLDDRHKQAQAVESVLERSQIRKRLAVAKLQEVCDRDTHDVVEATKAELGQEHQVRPIRAELAAVQDEWMAKRRHELNEVLVDSERRLDREKKNVAEKFQLETDVKRAALQRELEVDRASALREIEQTFQGDLEALEDRLRHVVAEELQAKRQQVATALLVREEELLQQGRTQALAMHQANEHADVAKLQDALQMGSKLRLQQVICKRSLEQLRNEHDGETNTHLSLMVCSVQRIRDDHERQRSERLVQLQQTYEAEYLLRMEVLEDELNAKLTADMNDRAADHAHALQKQVATCKQHFADLTTRLSSEMRIFFQVSNNPTISSRSNERNRQPNESKEADVVAKLHTLGVTSRDVHKWVHELSSEYYDLCDQHEVLVESLRQASAQTSTWKQKAATNEVALTRLQAKLDKAIADVHDKTRLCQRLYKANEQLLKQLPTSPP